MTFLVLWFFLVFLFLFCSSNLLLSLIVLEIISFMAIAVFRYYYSWCLFSDYYLITFFRIFVIEGVIGLSGLIILVFYSGTDYISLSSLIKL